MQAKRITASPAPLVVGDRIKVWMTDDYRSGDVYSQHLFVHEIAGGRPISAWTARGKRIAVDIWPCYLDETEARRVAQLRLQDDIHAAQAVAQRYSDALRKLSSTAPPSAIGRPWTAAEHAHAQEFAQSIVQRDAVDAGPELSPAKARRLLDKITGAAPQP